MGDTHSLKMLADDIRRMVASGSGKGESALENRISSYCAEMTVSEKVSFLEHLMEEFKPVQPPEKPAEQQDVLLQEIFSLILGKNLPVDAAASHEMLERLSEAMNTLFVTLNRIVKTIDATLLGETSGEQTIRRVIGSQVDGTHEYRSIEEYLGKIEKAFLVSHTAFRQAALTLFNRILSEMNPETIAAGADSRLKFGPMRKAEYFDLYETKYGTLKKWFDSGRFLKDFLREFENNCQTSV